MRFYSKIISFTLSLPNPGTPRAILTGTSPKIQEEAPESQIVKKMLRNYRLQMIFDGVQGLVTGRLRGYTEEQKRELRDCVTLDSEAVTVVEQAFAALATGATEPRAPRKQEAMVSRAFEDPDGHIWELLWVQEG